MGKLPKFKTTKQNKSDSIVSTAVSNQRLFRRVMDGAVIFLFDKAKLPHMRLLLKLFTRSTSS